MKDLNYNDLVAAFKYANPRILRGLVDNPDMFIAYGVDTDIRRNMFLAQLAHESDGFRTTREYASGNAYEGREDLGNTQTGDGARFRGRGLIQLTGRANYTRYGELLGKDLLTDPMIVEAMPLALEVSLMYWKDRKLNRFADENNFREVTRRVNGGYNGMEGRSRYLRVFRGMLGEA